MTTLNESKQDTPKQRDVKVAALKALAASGPLTPDRVIKAAKVPTSPLHRYFQWDIKKAALAHWRNQARDLIVSVEITTIVEDRPVSVSYFARDPSLEHGRQGYVGLDQLQANPSWARQHVQAELAAVLDRLARAEGYAAILNLKADVALVRQSVRTLADRVSGVSVAATP